MKTKPFIDIIIPVYNEGGNIKKNLDALQISLQKSAQNFSVYIIYDFEEDNTLPVIKQIQHHYPFPINLVKNKIKGVLNAIKTGFEWGSGEFVLITMADNSDDYDILPQMFEMASQGYDVICASRYMRGGRIYGGPFFKQFLSRLAGISLHYLTQIPTHDITNSFKLYRRKMVHSFQIESSGGFEIGFEITAKAYVHGYKIVEIPARWWDRTEGKSKFRLIRWLPNYLKWYFYLILQEILKKN